MISRSPVFASAASAAPSARKKRILAAPFGEYSRHVTSRYLQYTTLTLACLLAIALTVDLSQWLGRLIADPRTDGAAQTALFVGRYLLLRTPDILGRLLPFACFLGVVWCEVTAILSGQRITIWLTGRSPVQCLAPVVVVGILGGIGQYVLEAHLRPMVVRVQALEHIGEFGQRFDRSDKTDPEWLFAGDDVIRAQVSYLPAPTLRNLLLIRSSRDGRVSQIVTADRAILDSDGAWALEAGRSLPLVTAPSSSDNLATPNVASSKVERMRLSIDPLWLEYQGIDAKYLPQSVLDDLATRPNPTYAVQEYRTWRAARIGNAAAPFGMALMAATLALVLLPNALRIDGVSVIALAGYGSLVAMRSLYSLGERGVVPPWVAGWLAVVAMIVVSIVALLLQQRRIARLSTAPDAARAWPPTPG
jgi:lipopolysaccharide export system permease protein